MNVKRELRKWIALLIAAVGYFIVHEGAHLLFAVSVGSFKKINFIFPGIQIDVNARQMPDLQMGLFCLSGTLATLLLGYLLLAFMERITKINSLYLRAIFYDMTLCFLLVDPLYLSVLSPFAGGGDMNGVVRILPQTSVRIVAGMAAICHIAVLFGKVIPAYRTAYIEKEVNRK